MRRLLAIVTLTVLAVPAALTAGAGDPCEFGDVVLLASGGGVQIGQNAKILSGDVVANAAGGAVGVGGKATLAADVWGNSLSVAKFASVGGAAFCNQLSDESGNVTCAEFTPPVFDALPEFQPAAPGSENVTVANGQSRVLQPNRGYGAISGGVESTIIFEPGVYDVGSITLARKGDLLFRGPTTIRVAGAVTLGIEVDVKAEAGSAVAASEILFYVGGNADLGKKSTVTANVQLAGGTLKLPDNIIATGAFLAGSIEVGTKAEIRLDSAFDNAAPSAVPQSVDVGTSAPVTIELSGSDPEGDALTFSIEVGATFGSLTEPNPIQDSGQCSVTVQECDDDGDCPGTESCVLPPITRATVDYQNSTCATDPCPPDSFTFGVRDSCNLLGTAVVEINPVDPSPPAPDNNPVQAADLIVDTTVGTLTQINLSAGAPATAISLTFAVETLPAAAITDEGGTPITSAPFVLPSPVVRYQAGAAGLDSFVYSARETGSTGPCSSPTCDTASVNIDVGAQVELAEDVNVGTDLNAPVAIDLVANVGGSGSPVGGAPFTSQRSIGPAYTGFEQTTPSGAASGNGDDGSEARRVGTRRAASGPAMAAPPAGTIALGVDAGWSATSAVPPAFFWSDPSGQQAAVFACDANVGSCQGVFEFTLLGPGCLSVTDDFQKGDEFRVYDNGEVVGTTSDVAVDSGGLEVGPEAAYLDPTYSSGSFELGIGDHSIAIEVIANPFNSGRGYIRVDKGRCFAPTITVKSLPTKGTLSVAGTPVTVNQSFTAFSVSLLYTPNLGATGPDTFQYEVNTGVLADLGDVFITIGSDNCVFNGRDPGCVPGGGGSAPLAEGGASEGSSAAEARQRDPLRGPWLEVEVSGPGLVRSDPLRVLRGHVLGLSCGDGAVCATKFEAGSEITLLARPDDGAVFTGWGGDCYGTEQITTITVHHASRCTASFERYDE